MVTIGEGKSREKVPCVISPQAGYIVYKDKKPVIFYTNDLKTDVPKDYSAAIKVRSLISSVSLNSKLLRFPPRRNHQRKKWSIVCTELQ